MKCVFCRKEIEGRSNKKYCNDVCRSLNWKAQKRLKKKRDYNRSLIDKSNVVIDQSIIDLFNLLNNRN